MTTDTAPRRLGVIYVARVPIRNDLAPLSWGWKIGHTSGLGARMVGLTSECGVALLVAVGYGSRPDEIATHRRLRHLRVPRGPHGGHVVGCSREWYRDSDEFRAWLAAFPAAWRGEIAVASLANRSPHDPGPARMVGRLWRQLRSGGVSA